MICSKIKKYWRHLLRKMRQPKRRLDKRVVEHCQRLNDEARAARAPLPPHFLVEAKHDRIHRDVGVGRAAKTVRNQSGIEQIVAKAIERANSMTDEERDEFFEEQRAKAEQRAKISEMFTREYRISGEYKPTPLKWYEYHIGGYISDDKLDKMLEGPRRRADRRAKAAMLSGEKYHPGGYIPDDEDE